MNFSPAISKEAGKSIREKIRKTGIKRKTEWTIEAIAGILNPMIKGWIEYYGRYNLSAMRSVIRYLHQTIVGWAMRKYKKLKKHKTRGIDFLERVYGEKPNLFVHWKMFKPRDV